MQHIRSRKIITAFFGLFFILTFSYIFIGNAALPSDDWGQELESREYNGIWYQVLEDGSKNLVSLPTKLIAERGEMITLITTLPLVIEENTYLCFRSAKQDMEFFINGEFRGSYSTRDTKLFGNASAAARYFLKVNPSDAGKELRMTAVTDTSYTGVIYAVGQGSQMELWRGVIRQYGWEMLISFCLIWTSVVAIIILLGVWMIQHIKLDVIYLVVGIFIAGCWEVANSDLRQFLFQNLSVVNDMAFLMILLLPFPYLIYMDRVQKEKYHGCYFAVEILVTVDFLVCTTLHCLHIQDYTNLFIGTVVVCFTAILLIAITIAIDVFTGDVKNYLFVALGILGASVTAVVQIISYFRRVEVFNGSVLIMGLFILFTFAILNTIRELEKMIRERQQALAADEAKSRFLAQISHEIRTPIHAILGMDIMILRESKEEHIRDYAMDINQAGQSLLALINDILDLSKIEAGKMELSEIDYDFSSLIHDIHTLFSIKAAEKGLSLMIHLDDDIPATLHGDDIRIRQVLVNLLNNAVKYTDQGSVTLSVDGSRDIDEVLLHFSVKDTGMGIRDEQREKLFEAFRRIDEETNRSIEGTGLGLSITSQLLELMGSRIQVQSIYGVGTEFSFELRQIIVDPEPIGNLEERIKNRNAGHAYKETFVAPDARILIVDDSAINRKVFVNLLKRTQIRIEEAESGMDCIKKIQKQRYDIIFLDHMMPGMDGCETLRHMKETDGWASRKTMVIALTANAVSGAREMYLEKGFDDFLMKPVTPGKLEQAIMEYLPQELVKPVATEDTN